MAQTQIQTLEDSSSGDEETRVSLRKKELEVIVIRTVQQVLEQTVLPKITHNIQQVMEHTILPKISAIVKQEVDLAIEKPLTRLNHHSGIGVQSSQSKTLQLVFMDKLCLPVKTNLTIKGEGSSPFRVALVDATTKQVVTSGHEASAEVDIVVVERDFDGDNWTLEEFNNKIVRGKEGRTSLLTGNVHLNLEAGVAFVREISFIHNRHWTRARVLRLGAKVVGNLNGTRVREAVTEPFLLEDYRKTYTEKHYPPSPNDEVWRLTNIAKDGPFHNRLVRENIKTVKDFLTQYCINPKSLQNILGAGKIWKSTVAHAQTCKILRLYYPIGSGKKSGVVFNAVGQVMGLIYECCYVPLYDFSEDQKADANKLVVSALEHMGDVMTFDDDTSLHSHLQLVNGAFHLSGAANPSNIPSTLSLGIMSVDPSFGNESCLNEQVLQNIPSTSSLDNQTFPLHVPNAANPSNIPSTDSLGNMSLDPNFGIENYLQNILSNSSHNNQVVAFRLPDDPFRGNESDLNNDFLVDPFNEGSVVDTNHSFEDVLGDSIIGEFCSARAANISKVQSNWKKIIATSMISSSEAVPASKKPRMY